MNLQDPTTSELSGAYADLTEMSVEDAVALEVSEMEAIIAADPSSGRAEIAIPAAPVIPAPLPIAKRAVSGRYNGTSGGWQVELRVDVDRVRPMRKLSGDFYSVSGGTTTYFGSFLVKNPTVSVTATHVTIRGLGEFTWGAGFPVINVTIQRRLISQPQAPAALQFFNQINSPGASYNCGFDSTHFRTVRLEIDRASDVTSPVFSSYNTGALPSGGPARNLTITSAFAQAGIQMVPTSGADVINIGEAGSGATWSNAELHRSMQRHFLLFRNVPQWVVWTAVCQNHEFGSGLLGIMFDQLGPQRQGCAVFYRGLAGSTAEALRLQLQTTVHELGHCFNLLHSWQKALATPPGVDRPASLSWMNYPWRYPVGGAAGFWARFPFQFDDTELVHLRHAFRNNIIMGGNPFTVGAGMVNPEIMGDTVFDESGLQLAISGANNSFALGEPVVVKLTLDSTDRRGKRVHPYLHPNTTLTNIVIAKPNGVVVAYEPFMDHLVGPQEQEIAGDYKIEDSAYIGYGKGGLYFDQPGNYQIRAIYHALDGSRVLSNVINMRVRYPVTAKDEELADLLMGQEQGALFYLLGSDADSLRRGNDAFDKVLEKYGDSPLADYVRLVKGTNAGRAFKTIVEGTNQIDLRKSDVAEAKRLIGALNTPACRVDEISRAQSMQRLAIAQRSAGDEKGAAESMRLGTRANEPVKAKAMAK
ncbi:MAG: hypothetical protein HY820_19780 [Acidobacteria bacterium]|nr:hypothetical protein [Acidobacteriota bacterium]